MRVVARTLKTKIIKHAKASCWLKIKQSCFSTVAIKTYNSGRYLIYAICTASARATAAKFIANCTVLS